MSSDDEKSAEDINSVESEDKIWDEPETVMFITDPEQIDKINSNDHYPIIAYLRHGYHTVKEITDAYPLFSSNPEKSKKSDKTIYRYLNELKKINLVKVVGQRVIRGQTATEKIWGRTAKIFYLDYGNNLASSTTECTDDCLACKDDGAHLDSLKGIAMAKLLEQVLGNVKGLENYGDWMESLDQKIKKEIMELIEKLPKDEIKYLAKLPYTSIDQILTISALMSLFRRKSKTLMKFYSVFDDAGIE